MSQKPMNQQSALTDHQDGGSFPVARLVRALSSQSDPDCTLGLGQTLPRPETRLPSSYRSNSQVWRLILTDKLTGLCNQHGFIALADQEWRVSRRSNGELVFVRLELANLPEISERFERGESDLAVIAAARILIRSFRRSDILCRWEGGAFRVLAVDADGLSEPMVKARIQSQVRKADARVSRYQLTFKGYVARISSRNADSFEHILARLDQDFDVFKRTWCGAEALQCS